MDSQTVSHIISASIGFFVVTLTGIVAWFTIRAVSSIDENMKANSESISKLAACVQDLAGVIKTVQSDVAIRHDGVERSIKEHHEEIEMLRDRTHEIGTWLTKIILYLKVEHGCDFAGDFSLSRVKVK